MRQPRGSTNDAQMRVSVSPDSVSELCSVESARTHHQHSKLFCGALWFPEMPDGLQRTMSEGKRVSSTPHVFTASGTSSRAQDFAWVARRDDVLGNVVGDDGASADDAAGADRDPGKNERARANECIFADCDFRRSERHTWLLEIVAAGAEIRFLRNGGARADLNLGQIIGVGPIAQACPIVQGQVPRHGDPGALMHERRAVDLCIENAQPKKSPRIQRLRRPRTKKRPANFPQSARGAIGGRPGRLVGGGLRRINDLWLRHWNF